MFTSYTSDPKFYNFENIDEFCKFVFDKEHKGYTFIAHNSKGYDAQFILKYCVKNGLKPYCIYSGSKIMSMTIQAFKIRFIDSINFVQVAFASFRKTFGLKEILGKYEKKVVNSLKFCPNFC